MSDIARLLSQKRVYVKPAMGGWIVLEMTPLRSFLDDLLVFDPIIAFYNLMWHMRGNKK